MLAGLLTEAIDWRALFAALELRTRYPLLDLPLRGREMRGIVSAMFAAQFVITSFIIYMAVHAAGDSRISYWNTGSWIYEPDLGSRQAYARYLRYAWPGTAVLIDTDHPEPRLLELLADLNPLHDGPGLPSA